MKDKRILYVSSEVVPYLPETEIASTAFNVAKKAHSKGVQTRIFMPRFGVINERRHQLHEVIRLSGMNLIINDMDMPLIIKVASIPKERMQVYFIDNDELIYSLRSIAKNCAWVNHIYIVTDAQRPEWLEKECSNVTIIDHKEIFECEEHLPTYNSMAIEWNITNIKDLSEHFIYLNDDMFFGKALSDSYFFDAEKRARLFCVKKRSTENELLDKSLIQKDNPYQHAIVNSRQAVYDKTGYLANSHPAHGAYVFNKSTLLELKEVYSELVEQTVSSRFRTNKNVFIYALYSFHQQSCGVSVTSIKRLKKEPWMYRLLPKFNSDDYYLYAGLDVRRKRLTRYYKLIELFSPSMYCINDCADATPSRREEMRLFLEKMYPEKSPYEKCTSLQAGLNRE